MSFWPILLRALISISLILNGSGYAVASTHMQMGHMSTVASVPQPPAEPVATAEPPCHQHQVNASAAAAQLPDAVHDKAPAKSKHPSPDCCKSGACRGTCTHQAQTALHTHPLRYAGVEPVSGVRPLKPGHAAPALPHPIRPPIG